MNHKYSLEYNNVRVRPLKKDDIEKLRIWRNNTNNTKFLSRIPHITEDKQEEWYRNYIYNKNEIIFAIEEITELNRIVGSVSLYNFEYDQVEFGRILIGDEEAHGKKIGLNSTKAILMIAFEILKKEVVVLKCYKDNKKAISIYKKSGFSIKDEFLDNNNHIEYLMEIDKKVFKRLKEEG